jgi:hypothetical protein
MSAAHSDRNLLYGILALQMDFISREQFVEAMHAWVLHKDRPLGEILCQQGALLVQDHHLLEQMVNRHLQRTFPTGANHEPQHQAALRVVHRPRTSGWCRCTHDILPASVA